MKKRISVLALALAVLLGLSGCGKPAAATGPVKIATKPMTEQYILGEMLGLLIEDAGYEVGLTSAPPWKRGSSTSTRSTPPAAG